MFCFLYHSKQYVTEFHLCQIMFIIRVFVSMFTIFQPSQTYNFINTFQWMIVWIKLISGTNRKLAYNAWLIRAMITVPNPLEENNWLDSTAALFECTDWGWLHCRHLIVFWLFYEFWIASYWYLFLPVKRSTLWSLTVLAYPGVSNLMDSFSDLLLHNLIVINLVYVALSVDPCN